MLKTCLQTSEAAGNIIQLASADSLQHQAATTLVASSNFALMANCGRSRERSICFQRSLRNPSTPVDDGA